MKLLYCQLITLKQTHCFAALLSFFIEGNGWTNNFIKSAFSYTFTSTAYQLALGEDKILYKFFSNIDIFTCFYTAGKTTTKLLLLIIIIIYINIYLYLYILSRDNIRQDSVKFHTGDGVFI